MHLLSVIPAFMEEPDCTVRKPRTGQRKQGRQGRKCPRRNDLRARDEGVKVFNSARMHLRRQSEFTDHGIAGIRSFSGCFLQDRPVRRVDLPSEMPESVPENRHRSRGRASWSLRGPTWQAARCPEHGETIRRRALNCADRLIRRDHFWNICSNATRRSNVSRETGPASSCRRGDIRLQAAPAWISRSKCLICDTMIASAAGVMPSIRCASASDRG